MGGVQTYGGVITYGSTEKYGGHPNICRAKIIQYRSAATRYDSSYMLICNNLVYSAPGGDL